LLPDWICPTFGTGTVIAAPNVAQAESARLYVGLKGSSAAAVMDAKELWREYRI
jgi:hypothetical protein